MFPAGLPLFFKDAAVSPSSHCKRRCHRVASFPCPGTSGWHLLHFPDASASVPAPPSEDLLNASAPTDQPSSSSLANQPSSSSALLPAPDPEGFEDELPQAPGPEGFENISAPDPEGFKDACSQPPSTSKAPSTWLPYTPPQLVSRHPALSSLASRILPSQLSLASRPPAPPSPASKSPAPPSLQSSKTPFQSASWSTSSSSATKGDLQAVRLNSVPLQGDLQAVRLNSVPLQGDLQAVRLNSVLLHGDLLAICMNCVLFLALLPRPPPPALFGLSCVLVICFGLFT
ncbi:hypothetical protein CRENBAI_015988 [Crenichthys baileyi]|uniref:Uncharacterized protein n=1 Tax=Crenichthys baileyi TaxID=28760 RepID=A0AAV9RXV5_9TELE